MSYDVWLTVDTGGDQPATVYDDWNYTSNCSPMWNTAGAPLHEYDGKLASECAPGLQAAIDLMQAQKSVAIVEKKTSKIYVGFDARQLLGLPDYEVRVQPDQTPEYQIFVQSTSVNRLLMAGTKLLVLL